MAFSIALAAGRKAHTYIRVFISSGARCLPSEPTKALHLIAHDSPFEVTAEIDPSGGADAFRPVDIFTCVMALKSQRESAQAAG